MITLERFQSLRNKLKNKLKNKPIKICVILPAVYILVCIAFWISFIYTSHDGLANLGLFMITMPMSILERAIAFQLFGSFDQLPFWKPMFLRFGLPSGYLLDHVYWFFPLVCIQSYLLFIIGRWLDKKKLF